MKKRTQKITKSKIEVQNGKYPGTSGHPGSERALEQKRRAEVDAEGGWYLKQTGHPGVPDRLVLMPVPEEDRELVSRYVRFEELKSPAGRLSAIQERVIGWLRSMGYRVDVFDRFKSRP